jgi:hypothetical protein
MRSVLLLALVAGALSAEPTKDPPARADILAGHKLYPLEPACEKEFVGVLRKGDKGAYFLELAAGTEDLVLYADAGDPLAPYVGKRLRLVGKQVIGAVGQRTARQTLPGRLEVLVADKKEPEEIAPPDRTRQEDDLGRIEEEIRKRQEELKRKEAAPPAPGEKNRAP